MYHADHLLHGDYVRRRADVVVIVSAAVDRTRAIGKATPGCRQHATIFRMRISPNDIIEEVIDTLVTGDLAEPFPGIKVSRLADNQIVIDVGLPDRDFVLTVEARPR